MVLGRWAILCVIAWTQAEFCKSLKGFLSNSLLIRELYLISTFLAFLAFLRLPNWLKPQSSLVCAICLGLGWTPTHLGRADDYKSFIKYGKKDATIEIELKAKSNEHNNHTIKVQIIKDAASKDGSKRRWWINGKDATLGKVRDLTRELSIQIDNLCQFLPQDKVSEFAALSAKDLLHSTQRAAAPPEMLTWHDQLISLRKKQKDLQLKHDTDTASLESYQKKRDGLQDDVNKLQDRANAEKKIELLRKARPFIEYKVRRDEFNAAKDKKKEANVQLRRLQARVNPTLEALNEKEEYQRQIEAVEKERIQSAKNAERALAATVKEREDIEHRIKQIEDARKSEQDSDANRKRAKVAIERKISDLRAQLQQVPEFDAADWNRRIVSVFKTITNTYADLVLERWGKHWQSRPEWHWWYQRYVLLLRVDGHLVDCG